MLAFPSVGNAMEFSTQTDMTSDGSQTFLRAEGEIVAGDYGRFLAYLQDNPPSENILLITSPGGEVGEAILIAEAIKVLNFSVVVLDECASACAMIIFPAGEYSILAHGSVLRIHSCSEAGERSELCNEDIAQLAVKNGFPYGIIRIFSDLYGPGDMKWMTEISARCFGFYRGSGDPKPIDGKKACVDGYLFTAETMATPFWT